MTRKQMITFVGILVVAITLAHYVSITFHFQPSTTYGLHILLAVGASACFLVKVGQTKTVSRYGTKHIVRDFLNNIDAAVIVTDLEGNITIINSKAREICGIGLDINVNIKEFSSESDSPLHYLAQTLVGSQVYQEHYFTYQNGEDIQYFYLNSISLLNEAGQPSGAIFVAWPTSEQSFLGRQISQSGKLTMIGELAAGTAHEIRNPLTSVRGLIQIMDQRLSDQDPAKEYISVIIREIDQINHIIKELLLLARRTTPNLSFASLPAMLDYILSLIEGEAAGKGITLYKYFQEDLPLMVLDEDQVKQVFWHLASNAIYAMPGGGRLTVAAVYKESQGLVEVSFTDTGVGISKENMSRIFLPFFTTRAEGTGLGLPVSYQIVDNHGGKLSVKTETGKGSTFTVKLPMVNYKKTKAS
ncbi:two-component system sensor histidine kinase NtrB [Desulforamulus aeronauticus]|uniref:histidine kinase n=1 Tax=Desulforamulus aeronauticus DSM 10349 TaxID=1121421 RepID=A0A1M6NFG5_9FIRM|nr:ATP-binding protein [Desulforamulus aeronauticus]SHJ94491.1 His Kinase A (phospho-acceptor) domain-containing protein [Desulforamulus aeronauticus DSM 10349]